MKYKLERIKLENIISFKNGKKRPDSFGNIPVYGGNGILDYTNLYNYENCIVIGRVGAYCGSVFYEKNKMWISDNAIAAIAKDNSDIVYDYYLLKSLQLNKRNIGTGQPLLTQGILNNIECYIPDLSIQKKIAIILKSIDDKIDLNNCINNNLAA